MRYNAHINKPSDKNIPTIPVYDRFTLHPSECHQNRAANDTSSSLTPKFPLPPPSDRACASPRSDGPRCHPAQSNAKHSSFTPIHHLPISYIYVLTTADPQIHRCTITPSAMSNSPNATGVLMKSSSFHRIPHVLSSQYTIPSYKISTQGSGRGSR